jgi:hypothetical protein
MPNKDFGGFCSRLRPITMGDFRDPKGCNDGSGILVQSLICYCAIVTVRAAPGAVRR